MTKEGIIFGLVAGITIAVVLAVIIAANSHFGFLVIKSPI